jgi:hypothetical protein
MDSITQLRPKDAVSFKITSCGDLSIFRLRQLVSCWKKRRSDVVTSWKGSGQWDPLRMVWFACCAESWLPHLVFRFLRISFSKFNSKFEDKKQEYLYSTLVYKDWCRVKATLQSDLHPLSQKINFWNLNRILCRGFLRKLSTSSSLQFHIGSNSSLPSSLAWIKVDICSATHQSFDTWHSSVEKDCSLIK